MGEKIYIIEMEIWYIFSVKKNSEDLIYETLEKVKSKVLIVVIIYYSIK